MFLTIYVETAVREHSRTREILSRYPQATVVECRNYGEIFNRKSQNFRLQKQNTALILAEKFKGHVLPAPDAYGIGGDHNFYFSHMLNCMYDCRYCFLQGMYRSAYYVLFVNYESFQDAIRQTLDAHPGKRCYFYSGYDCDSLALEPVTGFASHFLDYFNGLDNAWIELRTKSTQIRSLLDRPAMENCVVAFSLSPQTVIDAVEHKTPSLDKRLQAIGKLQQHGWPIGLRFDPVILEPDFKETYGAFFKKVFSTVQPDKLHSISLGAFRLPDTYFKNIVKLYPQDPLFSGALQQKGKLITYEADREKFMLDYCSDAILKYASADLFFPCTTE